jgi:hypothetical protein
VGEFLGDLFPKKNRHSSKGRDVDNESSH